MIRLARTAHVWLFTLTLLLTSLARAQEAADEVSALDARNAALLTSLEDVKRPTRMYFGGWLTALSGLAVGQATISLFLDDKAQRTAMWVGAGLSVGGIGLLLITPFPGRYGADELRRMPEGTLAEKQAKAARGEELLETERDSAWFQRAWFQHVFTSLLGGGVALGLGLLYPDDFWLVGLPAGIGTFLTAEAQIWTRPRRAIDHWERYQKGVQVSAAPWVTPEGGGLGLRGQF